jgi:S1-C subfamily serine protease
MNETLQALSNGLADAVERVGRSLVAVHARRRIPASGVVWRPGVIVTAHHTLERDEDLSVTLDGGATVPATLAGRDPGTDLAVLRFEGDAPAAEQADGAELRVGSLVLALGRPGASVTASLGAISSVGGEWRTRGGGRIDRVVRLDLDIYDGFSGGALVSAGGRVLGINTSWLARGAPLTLPAATVDRVADQLLERGHVPRAFLGLGGQAVRIPPASRGTGEAGDTGVMVVSVAPGGPADRAGILLGDVVLSFAGVPVSDPGEVLAVLGAQPVGAVVPVRLLRAGALTELSVTIGEYPRTREG